MPKHDPDEILDRTSSTTGTPPADQPGWAEDIDPDTDLRAHHEHTESQHSLHVLAATAIGGMIGAASRYVVSQIWPTHTGSFPWSTFAINVSGCFVLGVLMAYIGSRESTHPLLRPFLATGIVSGYTTFSTYVLETDSLLQHHQPLLGLTYMSTSVIAGVTSALAGHTLTDRLGRPVDRGVRA